MSHRDHRPDRNHSAPASSRRDPDVTAGRIAPGKQTLTMGLASRGPAGAAPVQHKLHGGVATPSHADSAPVEDWMRVAMRPDLYQTPVMRKSANELGYAGGDDAAKQAAGGTSDLVHQAAADGLAGSSARLPFLDQIQHSFGQHDVSSIQAHTDSHAARGSQAMGAEAFAAGEHVAFAGAPSLHTAAHEAAHVVQQRAGVQLAGGVGQAGDRYEQNADAVADMVVQGKSAEHLLAQHAGPARASAGPTSIQQLPVQRRINILPEHFVRGLEVPLDQVTNEQLDEYIRIAVFDDVKYVLQKSKQLNQPERRKQVAEAWRALSTKGGQPQDRLNTLATLIPLVNTLLDTLDEAQPYWEEKHQQNSGQGALIPHPHRATRYATKPVDGYSHTSLSTGEPEGIKWGSDDRMWSQLANDVGPGVTEGAYETVKPAKQGLPLTQLPWEEAKRILPRPMINLIFDVRYQLESQNQVVIDERTPYELGRQEKSPHAPGTLRSWHQDSKGVLPEKVKRTAALEGGTAPHGNALHQHYTANSQTGAGSSIQEGVNGPQGLAEYTGTGSNWEHQTKIVLDYVSKRVYLTLSHYQYWALVPKSGGGYEFWPGDTQDLNQVHGKLEKDFRGQDVQPILMSPWMEILMPTSDSLGKGSKDKGKGKAQGGSVVRDSNDNNEVPSSSGVDNQISVSSARHDEKPEEKHTQPQDVQRAIEKKIEESSSSEFKPTSEHTQEAREIIQSTGMQPKTPVVEPGLQVSKAQARTLLRNNERAMSPALQNLMMLAIPVVIAAIIYMLFGR